MSVIENFRTLMRNRESLYRFFARLFQKEIDEEFYEQLKQVRFPVNREETALTELQDALLRLNEYFTYDAGETLEDFAVDYAKTFLGAGSAQTAAAFPYESVYTSPKRIMMQDAWVQVSEIFREKGIERDEKQCDLLEDHIAMELEYMAWLCDETAQQTETLFGLQEQKEFLNRHLLNWVPEFCLDIKYYADTEFYRMVGQLTTGFLQFDSYVLDSMIDARMSREQTQTSYRVSRARLNEILSEQEQYYEFYGPKRFREQGMRETDGLIRYAQIHSIDEIVNDEQSDFSSKEIYYPISQSIFRFDEHSIQMTMPGQQKGIIVFARPCDIEGTKRLDNMFLANGGIEDPYYKTMRNKVKFFLLECPESFADCCCVSMGANKTDHYSVALRLGKQNGFSDADIAERKAAGLCDARDADTGFDEIEIRVREMEFDEWFSLEEESDYEPRFIEENAKIMHVPQIEDEKMLRRVFRLDMWSEYKDNCISCGGCNAVCISCSCFHTTDDLNQENSRRGERRRIWSSCMMPEYSKTAGGHFARPYADTMMRFKTLHKIYDYNKRFGGNEHMCIGCGRCSMRCPKDISFFDTVNRLHDEVEKLREERQSWE